MSIRKYTDKVVRDSVGEMADIIFNDRFRHLRQHGAYLNREYFRVHAKRERLYRAIIGAWPEIQLTERNLTVQE